MKTIIRFALAMIFAALALGAAAQTTITAQVSTIEMNTYTSTTTWNLRITMPSGTGSFCSAGANSGWAYLNLGEPGYDDYSSLLKYSKGAGLTVSVYTEPVTVSSTTACHIRDVKLN